MNGKSTDDLKNELMDAPDIARFLDDNRESFLSRSFAEELQELFARRGLSKAALAKNSGMSEVYLYQIFSGGRHPSRDRVLCLCFGLTATLEEAQALLRCGGHAQLFARDRRDAILIHGLTHGASLSQVNDRLFQEEEKTLY